MVDLDNHYIFSLSCDKKQSNSQQSQTLRISRDLLDLADNLARQCRITEAFSNYSKAFKLWPSYPPEVLQCFAEALTNSHTNRFILAHMSTEKHTLFRCYLCKAVLYKPTTLSCGHTFCHKCLQNDETWVCRLCGITDCILDRKRCPPTTLLHNLITKVFPKHCLAEQMRQDGKKHMQRKDYRGAIGIFTQALVEAPSYHLVLSNRSLAYSSLEQYNLALKDAEKVVEMQPTWSKGYYRKGCILHEMHNYEAAVTALLDCLTLNPYWSRPKDRLLVALHQLLSEDVKQEENLCNTSLYHSLTKRAQLACMPRTEIAPSKGASSKQQVSYPWFQVNKISKSKPSDCVLDEECQPDLAVLGAAAAATSFEDSFSEKSTSDCEYSEDDECCPHSRNKKSHSLPTIFNDQTFVGSIPTHAASDSTLLQSLYNSWPEERGQQRLEEMSVQEEPRPSCTSWSKQFHSSSLLMCDLSCCKPLTQLLKQDDLQCSLCLFLLYQPLVTPCGHAFCRECLVRSLDHSPQCPLCKQSLTTYLAARKWSISECLENIVKSFFPTELERRKQIYEEEMSKLARVEDNCEIPVFVCTFACPTIRCPLHIFEPRYRLMIRRCMECGSNQFGMTTPIQSGVYSEYGCMLKIKNVQILDDGRSLLDTVGDRRFKVIEKGTKDGYNIATVSFLKDDPIESSERADLLELEQEVYLMCKQWLNCILAENLRRIIDHYGPLPIPDEAELDSPNGPSWVWWMITILPIDKKLQVTAMSFTKLHRRLQFIKTAILTIQSKLSS